MMIGELEVVVVPEIPGQLHPEQRSLYQVDIVSKAVLKLCQKRECGPLQASEMIEKLCLVSCHPPSIDNGARHQIVTCVEPAPGS